MVIRKPYLIIKTLAGVGVIWLLVSLFVIRTSVDNNRPSELRR